MEDLVVELLRNYLKLEKIKKEKNYENLSWSDKDDLRLLYDNDAKYYYEECNLNREDALKGDTIISFWTIYCRLLKLEANWTVAKCAKSIGNIEALLERINATWKNDYTDKIKKVNKKLEPFVKVYATKGNFMLLPERRMNTQRYRIVEDRIDMTLYECFSKGALSKFFDTDDELISWIEKEKLECMFTDKLILKENIHWFTKETKPKWISEMNAEEIYEYVDNAVSLINERNSMR